MVASILRAYDAEYNTMLLQRVTVHPRRVFHDKLGGPFILIIDDQVDSRVGICCRYVVTDDAADCSFILLMITVHEVSVE